MKPEVIATRADSTEAPASASPIVSPGCRPPSTGASLTLAAVTVSATRDVLEPSPTDTEKPVDAACPGAT